MKHNVDVINGINKIFIEMSKCEVPDKEISKVINTYKKIINGNV